MGWVGGSVVCVSESTTASSSSSIPSPLLSSPFCPSAPKQTHKSRLVSVKKTRVPPPHRKFSMSTSVFFTSDEYTSEPTIGQNGTWLIGCVCVLVVCLFVCVCVCLFARNKNKIESVVGRPTHRPTVPSPSPPTSSPPLSLPWAPAPARCPAPAPSCPSPVRPPAAARGRPSSWTC